MDEVLKDVDLLAVHGKWRRLSEQFEPAAPQTILRWAAGHFAEGLTLGTGLGPSGIVLMHIMCQIMPQPTIFFLDTGFHFEETYDLIRRLETHFDIRIESVRPGLTPEEQAVREGAALWTTNPDRCCYLRKVEPLRRRLRPYSAWVTGIRRDQGATRTETPIVHYVQAYDVVKINPLATWTRKMIWAYIHEHQLPYNVLHDQGYSSIGCAPCTEAVPGDAPERAGRWAGQGKVECGLHSAV